jgi:hypothetical protein
VVGVLYLTYVKKRSNNKQTSNTSRVWFHKNNQIPSNSMKKSASLGQAFSFFRQLIFLKILRVPLGKYYEYTKTPDGYPSNPDEWKKSPRNAFWYHIFVSVLWNLSSNADIGHRLTNNRSLIMHIVWSGIMHCKFSLNKKWI